MKVLLSVPSSQDCIDVLHAQVIALLVTVARAVIIITFSWISVNQKFILFVYSKKYLWTDIGNSIMTKGHILNILRNFFFFLHYPFTTKVLLLLLLLFKKIIVFVLILIFTGHCKAVWLTYVDIYAKVILLYLKQPSKSKVYFTVKCSLNEYKYGHLPLWSFSSVRAITPIAIALVKINFKYHWWWVSSTRVRVNASEFYCMHFFVDKIYI